MFALKLYKRNGACGAGGNLNTGIRVIGYFDYAEVTAMESFSQALFPVNAISGMTDFISYGIPLFPLTDKRARPDADGLDVLLSRKNSENSIYMVSALQIREEAYAATDKTNGKDFLSDICERVLKEMPEGIDANFWGVMGSFELLFVCAAKDLEQWRGVMEKLLSFRYIDNFIGRIPAFACVRVCGSNEGFTEQEAEMLIHCGIYSMPLSLDELAGNFGESLRKFPSGHDDKLEIKHTAYGEGLDIRLRAPFRSALELLTKNPALNFENPMFRSVNASVILDGEMFDGLKSGNTDLERLLKHKMIADKFSADMNRDLEILRVNIPRTVYLGISELTAALDRLLRNDYRHLLGLHLAPLLKIAVKCLYMSKNIKWSDLCGFVNDVAFYIGNCMKDDGVPLDGIHGTGAISPSAGMIIAYESIILSVASHIDSVTGAGRNSGWTVFLTVGQKETICSKRYFSQEIGDRDDPKLFGYCLPAVNCILPENILPFLLHETSHHLALNPDRKPRNTAFLYFVQGYITFLLNREFIISGINESNPEAAEQIAGEIMNWVSLSIENIEIINPWRYARSVAHYLDKFVTYQEQLAPEDKSPCTAFDIVCGTVSGFLDRGMYRCLYEVFREARADILAMEIGGYEIIEYLNLQLTLIENEHMPNKEKDHKYFLRTACVISYAAQKELKKSNIPLSEASVKQRVQTFNDRCSDMVENRKSHLGRLFQFASDYMGLVEPVVKYMRNSIKDRDFRLTEENFGLEPNALLSSGGNPDLRRQSELYLNKWFEMIKSSLTGDV